MYFLTLLLLMKVQTSFELLDMSFDISSSFLSSSLSDEAVIPTPFWHWYDNVPHSNSLYIYTYTTNISVGKVGSAITLLHAALRKQLTMCVVNVVSCFVGSVVLSHSLLPNNRTLFVLTSSVGTNLRWQTQCRLYGTM